MTEWVYPKEYVRRSGTVKAYRWKKSISGTFINDGDWIVLGDEFQNGFTLMSNEEFEKVYMEAPGQE